MLVPALYILFLFGFIVASALIIRHAITYGYLSKRFQLVVGIFVLLALIVIGFSIYLIFLYDDTGGNTDYYQPSSGYTEETGGSGGSGFNF